MNLDSKLTCYEKINSKWFIKVKCEKKTIELLVKHIGEILHDLGLTELYLTPKA